MIASEALRIFFAFIAVMGLIGVAALAARKAGFVSASGGFARKRRLSVVETLAVDARRRVAIIRCDEREHLIILGPASETVIARDLETPPTMEEPDAAAQTNPFGAFRAHLNLAAKSANKDAA